MKKFFLRYKILILTTVLFLFLDLFSKYLFAKEYIKEFTIIKNFFYFTPQHNEGIAFGINLGYLFQIIITILILVFLIYFAFNDIFKNNKKLLVNQILLALVLAGALGNLINRIFLSYVIDFIALGPIPVFNIADIGITLGLISLSIYNFKK